MGKVLDDIDPSRAFVHEVIHPLVDRHAIRLYGVEAIVAKLAVPITSVDKSLVAIGMVRVEVPVLGNEHFAIFGVGHRLVENPPNDRIAVRAEKRLFNPDIVVQSPVDEPSGRPLIVAVRATCRKELPELPIRGTREDVS